MNARTSRMISVLTLASVFTLVFAGPAHAYIDPGSGSLIVQVLIGVFAGVAAVAVGFWRRFAGLFSGRSRKGDAVTPAEASQASQDGTTGEQPR